jgi:hypothetical protein
MVHPVYVAIPHGTPWICCHQRRIDSGATAKGISKVNVISVTMKSDIKKKKNHNKYKQHAFCEI